MKYVPVIFGTFLSIFWTISDDFKRLSIEKYSQFKFYCNTDKTNMKTCKIYN